MCLSKGVRGFSFLIIFLSFTSSQVFSAEQKRSFSLSCAAMLGVSVSLLLGNGTTALLKKEIPQEESKLEFPGQIKPGEPIASAKQNVFLVEGVGSGFFISPDGYFLTALHVVDHELPPSYFWYFDLSALGEDFRGVGFEKPKSQTPDTVIPFRIVSSNGEVIATQARVVFLGSAIFFEKKIWEHYWGRDQVAFHSFTGNISELPALHQDFAVLKVDLIESLPYFSIRRNLLQEGEEVWSLGYPQSNGQSSWPLATSHGFVDDSAMNLGGWQQIVWRPNVRSLTNTARPGMSGGAEIDALGNAVGVLVIGALDHSSSAAVPMSLIYNIVVSKLGEDRAQEIFRVVR